MGLNSLSLDYIARLCTPTTLRNAQEYYRAGRVVNLVATGGGLQANVSGSRLYEIFVNQGTGDYLMATCTCSHDNLHLFCRHIIAVLLAWNGNTKNYVPTNEVRSRLGERSREELIALFEAACDKMPGLVEMLALEQVKTESLVKQISTILSESSLTNQANESQIIKILSPFCQEAENFYNLGNYNAARKTLFWVMKNILDCAWQQPALYKILPANFLAVCARRYVKIVLDDPTDQFNQAAIREEVNQLKQHPVAHDLTLDFSTLTLPVAALSGTAFDSLKQPA